MILDAVGKNPIGFLCKSYRKSYCNIGIPIGFANGSYRICTVTHEPKTSVYCPLNSQPALVRQERDVPVCKGFFAPQPANYHASPVCRRTPNQFSRSLAPPLESASQTLPAAKPTEKNIPRWIWCVSCGPGESRIQLFFSRPKSEDNEEIKNTCGYNLHANLCPHRTGSNEIQPLLCTTLQAANHINQKWRPGKRLKVKKKRLHTYARRCLSCFHCGTSAFSNLKPKVADLDRGPCKCVCTFGGALSAWRTIQLREQVAWANCLEKLEQNMIQSKSDELQEIGLL
jgi:hypothetical protein